MKNIFSSRSPLILGFGWVLVLSLTTAAQVTPVQPVRPVTTPRASWGGTPAATPQPSWAVQRPTGVRPVGTTAAPATQPASAALPTTSSTPSTPIPSANSPSSAASSNSPAATTTGYRTPNPAIPWELVDNPVLADLTRRDYSGAKDYEKCLELQKQSGACILVYFRNPQVDNERGLCSWFEKRLQSTREWQKATAFYLRVTITLPGNSEDRDLASRFGLTRTPSLYVVKPNDSRHARIQVVKWDTTGGKRDPSMATPAEAVPWLADASTPAYQTLLAPLLEKLK
ncbi:MAG: hypothetical protein IJT88_03470 [Kiritimatiellae bacterium]|nr:hypothetical protein [Kiritimatiellia bacterium]